MVLVFILLVIWMVLKAKGKTTVEVKFWGSRLGIERETSDKR